MNLMKLFRGLAFALGTTVIVGCASVSPYSSFAPAMPADKPNLLRYAPSSVDLKLSPLDLPKRTSVFAGTAVLGTLNARVSSALGITYVMGGNSISSGFDCSGLVRFLLDGLTITDLPRTSGAMSKVNAPTVARDNLEPGDLLFFNVYGRGVSHVGVYLGDGEFVHAAYSKKQVRVSKLDMAYWRKRFAGAKRVVSDDSTASQKG